MERDEQVRRDILTYELILIATLHTRMFTHARTHTYTRTHIQEKTMQRFELEKKNLVAKVLAGSGCGI